LTSGLSRHLQKKKSLSLFKVAAAIYIDGFQEIGEKKSEGRGPRRGVIGDELTDGKKPSSFFSLKMTLPCIHTLHRFFQFIKGRKKIRFTRLKKLV